MRTCLNFSLFIQEIKQGIEIKEGNVLVIPVAFRCRPKPVVVWSKTDVKEKDLQSKAMIAVGNNSTEFVIRKVQKCDAGIYKIKLENKCGEKKVFLDFIYKLDSKVTLF